MAAAFLVIKNSARLIQKG